ncbi:MAG TPA: ATP-binding protein [Pseudomonadota bacterium]|nr:ATP-binding protein [Pseudomonadota bacterium]
MSTSPARAERLPSSPSLEIPPSVLYVDDDRANLLAFRAIAEPQYVVVTARSAEEALRILEQRQDFAVLLSDQRMPGLSGIDLCERVHASHPDIERMLVTAYSDLGAAIAAINRGHVGRYLHKPWNTDELLATLRDAVERHRLRVMVQRLQVRISETERMYALGVLTASIGHELRTPLSVVTSSVEYCRQALRQSVAQLGAALPGASPALANLREIDSALSDAADGAQRLLEVVDGINLSARGEAPVRVPVDVSHVVQSVLRLVRGEAVQRAQLAVELQARPTVAGSATRLGQVLLNLVLNALQAMPTRPMLENQIRVILSEEGKHAVLRVSDNGTGIEPQKLARIFDPFFTTKLKGTGLGLAISRQIVEELGGEIDVESTVGVGTSFVVRLPLLPGSGG